MKSILSMASGILFLVSFLPYIRGILRGETKSSKASWIIWASLDTISLCGMYAKGTLNGQIIGAVLGAWVVVALALRYGVSGWTKLDVICLIGAVLGIFLWWLSNEPTVGILTSAIVVVLGSFPTFVTAWRNPLHENKVAWTIMFISCICALIAVPQWTLADAAQPVAFTIVETTMIFLLWIRPRFKIQVEALISAPAES
ncbi:MAG: hypothetical protein JWM56_1032 [Candidatus Peribacteria bacterium]|nr:hypothetical protein [Candidatus Peribacteria bacterium]